MTSIAEEGCCCAYCGKPGESRKAREGGGSGGLLQCSGCSGAAKYCNELCQRSDWARHKFFCDRFQSRECCICGECNKTLSDDKRIISFCSCKKAVGHARCYLNKHRTGGSESQICPKCNWFFAGEILVAWGLEELNETRQWLISFQERNGQAMTEEDIDFMEWELVEPKKNLALGLLQKGDHLKCYELYLELFDFFKRQEEWTEFALVGIRLVPVLIALGRYEECKEVLGKVDECMGNTFDSAVIHQLASEVRGILCSSIGDFDSAIEFFEAFLSRSAETQSWSDEDKEYHIKRSEIHIRLIDAYKQKKDWKRACEVSQEAYNQAMSFLGSKHIYTKKIRHMYEGIIRSKKENKKRENATKDFVNVGIMLLTPTALVTDSSVPGLNGRSVTFGFPDRDIGGYSVRLRNTNSLKPTCSELVSSGPFYLLPSQVIFDTGTLCRIRSATQYDGSRALILSYYRLKLQYVIVLDCDGNKKFRVPRYNVVPELMVEKDNLPSFWK